MADTLTGGYLSDMFGDSNARDQFNRSLAGMEAQSDANNAAYRRRYQWTVEDMKAAGLNPILAASGGFSVGSSPSVGLPAASQAQITTGFPSSASSAKEYQQAETEMEKQRNLMKDTALKSNQAKTEMEKAVKTRAETSKISQEEKESVQRMYLYMKQCDEILAKIYLMESQTQEAESRTRYVDQQRKESQENVELIRKNVQKLKYEAVKLKQSSEVYGGTFGKILSYTDAITKAIGNIGAAAIGGAALLIK